MLFIVQSFPSTIFAVFLHLGHRRLIQKVVNNGKGLLPVIITFKQNPLKIISKKLFQGNILSLSQKLFKLSQLGVNTIILIDFSHKFSTLRGRIFFKKIIELIRDRLEKKEK